MKFVFDSGEWSGFKKKGHPHRASRKTVFENVVNIFTS